MLNSNFVSCPSGISSSGEMSELDNFHEVEWVAAPKAPYIMKYIFHDNGYNIMISNLTLLYSEKLQENDILERFCQLNPFAQMKSHVILVNLKKALQKCLDDNIELNMKQQSDTLIITLTFPAGLVSCNYDIEMDLMGAEKITQYIIGPTIFGALLSHRKFLELQKKVLSYESSKSSLSCVLNMNSSLEGEKTEMTSDDHCKAGTNIKKGRAHCRCIICGLKNNEADVKMHRFPKESNICQKWVEACSSEFLKKLTPEVCHAKYRVCSNHFQQADYLNSRVLHKDAVPTLNLRNYIPIASKDAVNPEWLKGQSISIENILSSFLKMQSHFQGLCSENDKAYNPIKKEKLKNESSSHSLSVQKKTKLQELTNDESVIKFEDHVEGISIKKEETEYTNNSSEPAKNTTKKKKVFKI